MYPPCFNHTTHYLTKGGPKIDKLQHYSGLFYTTHTSKSPSKGTIILTHGMFEHSGRYDHLIEYLNTQGFTVVAYDLRGHGRSEGRQGHINEFGQYVEDLYSILYLVKQSTGDSPIFMFGHSMGGLITYLFLNRYSSLGAINGAVLTAPALNVPLNLFKSAKLLAAQKLRMIAPYLDAGECSRVERLTNDPKMVEKFLTDTLRLKGMTISLAVELVAATEEAQALIKDQSIKLPPILFIQGDKDQVVDAKKNLLNAKSMVPPELLHVIRGGLHEPINAKPKVRDKVMHLISDFYSDNLSEMTH